MFNKHLLLLIEHLGRTKLLVNIKNKNRKRNHEEYAWCTVYTPCQDSSFITILYASRI